MQSRVVRPKSLPKISGSARGGSAAVALAAVRARRTTLVRVGGACPSETISIPWSACRSVGTRTRKSTERSRFLLPLGDRSGHQAVRRAARRARPRTSRARSVALCSAISPVVHRGRVRRGARLPVPSAQGRGIDDPGSATPSTRRHDRAQPGLRVAENVVHRVEAVVRASGSTVKERMTSVWFASCGRDLEYVFVTHGFDQLSVPVVGDISVRKRNANGRVSSALGQAAEYRVGLRCQSLVRGCDEGFVGLAPSGFEVRGDFVGSRDVDPESPPERP